MDNRIFNFNTKIKISILIALSIVLMYFRFGLPLLPNFLDFDFSDIPILFIGLMFSPILGVLSMAIKNILVVLIIGSFTFGIGELANFLIGSCFVFTVSFLFHKTKGNKKYILSFIFGMISLVVLGVILNYFVILPTYLRVLGVDLSELIGGYNIIQYLILYIVPYNIIKCFIIFLPTMFIFSKFKKINSRITS